MTWIHHFQFRDSGGVMRLNWPVRLMEYLGYPGIALAVALENLFPPIPSEIVLPFAGFLTTRGALTLAGAVSAATIGSVAGALVLYFAGKLLGREWILRFVHRFGPYLGVRETGVRRAGQWFTRYGGWTVFFCRMVPTLRSLISIPAGLVGMPITPFILYTAAGALIWNLLLVSGGAALGKSWTRVSVWMQHYRNAALIAAALAGIAVLGLWLRRRQLARMHREDKWMQ